MKPGKLTPEELKHIVLSRLPALSGDVQVGPGNGLDCAAITSPEGRIVLSSDPITGATAHIGSLAIHVSCNDLAAFGVVPKAIMLVLIAPISATSSDIAGVIDQAADAARQLNVDIIGGHTEISDSVNRFVVTTTAVGFQTGVLTHSGGSKPGDALLMTKKAALEGTAILASDLADELKNVLTQEEILAAQEMIRQISVVPEGILAGQFGVHAMHDATEGGMLGAVWEMAEAAELGITIDEDAIPVHPLTKKICSHFSLDPYRLISSGSMLIATDHPNEIIDLLTAANIEVNRIGQFESTDTRLLTRNGVMRPLSAPQRDELYKCVD